MYKYGLFMRTYEHEELHHIHAFCEHEYEYDQLTFVTMLTDFLLLMKGAGQECEISHEGHKSIPLNKTITATG